MSQDLAAAWSCAKRIAASQEEKLDALWRTADGAASAFSSDVRLFVFDPDPEVRWVALQTLVLDLDQKGEREISLCRERLINDDDDLVRSTAAGCLGSALFGSRDKEVFHLLRERLERDPSWIVRSAAYNAIMSLDGRGPDEWFALPSGRYFHDEDVDWEKIATIEAKLDEQPSGETDTVPGRGS